MVGRVYHLQLQDHLFSTLAVVVVETKVRQVAVLEALVVAVMAELQQQEQQILVGAAAAQIMYLAVCLALMVVLE